jgi:hypothetical protein
MDDRELRKQILKIAPTLKAVLHNIESKLTSLPKSDFQFETNVKPFKSIVRKMKDKEGEIDSVADLSDLIRGRLFFSKNHDYNSTLDLLKNMFGSGIKKVDNPDKDIFGVEYDGIIHVDLNINGVNFELQLLPIEYKPAKEFLHKIYEQFREPEKRARLTDAQKKKLKDIHNKLHHHLLDKADKNRK